jgi:hypothetical protein
MASPVPLIPWYHGPKYRRKSIPSVATQEWHITCLGCNPVFLDGSRDSNWMARRSMGPRAICGAPHPSRVPRCPHPYGGDPRKVPRHCSSAVSTVIAIYINPRAPLLRPPETRTDQLGVFGQNAPSIQLPATLGTSPSPVASDSLSSLSLLSPPALGTIQLLSASRPRMLREPHV